MVGLDQLVVAGRQAATKSQCGQISDVVARLACGRKPPGAMNGAAVWLSGSWLVDSSLASSNKSCSSLSYWGEKNLN